MRSLDTVQEERSKLARLPPVPLIKLTTYSDRDARTPGDTFYFSKQTLRYDYGNTGTVIRFNPWLLSLGDLEASMVYLANPGLGEMLSKRFSLSLRNMLWPDDASGDRVIELLRETYNIEGAAIEVSQLILHEFTKPGPLDLTSYDGDEHTLLWSGRVERLGPISDEAIQLQCEMDSPEVVWGRATDPATAAPRDLGARFPRPYGAIKKLPLVAHTTGWATTLAQSINATEMGVKSITDGSGLGSSGSVQIEGEEISYSAASDTTITISSRGSGAAVHNAGAAVIELISEMVLVVADDGAAPISDVTALYVRNPFNGQLARITTGSTFTASDTALISGKTVSTIRFTQAQLRSLYTDLYTSARVTVQAVYSQSGDTPPSQETNEPAGTGVHHASLGALRGYWTTGPLTWEAHASYPRQGWKAAYTSGQGLNNTKDVIKWRVTFAIETTQVNSGTTEARLETLTAISGIAIGTGVTLEVPAVMSGTASGQTAWYTPAAGTKLYSLVGDELFVYTIRPGGTRDYKVTTWGIEAVLDEGVSIDREVDAESIGAGLGYDHEFFADVEGTLVPSSTEWQEVYDLDDDSGWSVSTGVTRTTDSGIYYTGSSASQKLEFAPTVRVQCESADNSEAANWTGGNTTHSDVSSSPSPTQGSSAVKGASDDDDYFQNTFTLPSPIDLTAGDKLYVLVDVYMHLLSSTSSTVDFYLGSDSSNRKTWEYDADDFTEDTWVTVIIDYEATEDYVAGSPDFSAWDWFQVVGNWSGSQAGTYCIVDNIRTIPKLGKAQRNSISPTLDMSSDEDNWRFALRVNADAKELFSSVKVYFDNSAASGTTLPSPVSYAVLDNADFGAADAWVLDVSSDSNAGDENAVQTIAIELLMLGKDVYSVASGTLIAYVDTIQGEQHLADNYDAAQGAMIEKPTDIHVHWIEEIGGATIDTTTLAASLTNLGSDKLAVDMRSLTPGDWKAALAGLDYLSRANTIPAETASGTVYKVLTAESDYEWPAAVRRISVWNTFAEAGPMGREIYTRWTAFYDFNPASGQGNERAYEAWLQANEDDNDLSNPATGEFTTAAAAYGSSEAPPAFFNGINDAATAKDVWGYYVHEGIRAPRLFIFEGCKWWEVYDLEVGDIIDFAHPWSGATIKARILQYTKRFGTETPELRCLEVQ